jgi:fructose/tagatose bisphosphate aldolase
VGGKDAIAQVVKTWALPPAPSTSGLLESARQGGYAVGAFNVYNLEGVAAVVGAAEELRSPAILQVRAAGFQVSH